MEAVLHTIRHVPTRVTTLDSLWDLLWVHSFTDTFFGKKFFHSGWTLEKSAIQSPWTRGLLGKAPGTTQHQIGAAACVIVSIVVVVGVVVAAAAVMHLCTYVYIKRRRSTTAIAAIVGQRRRVISAVYSAVYVLSTVRAAAWLTRSTARRPSSVRA
jgi:hypothetical protein